MRALAVSSVSLFVLVLAVSSIAPMVSAQSTALVSCGGIGAPPQATAVINAILGIFVAIQVVIYAVIGLAWITGNLMWSAPTRSMIVKKGGQQQMEIAGIALFLTLLGPGIFAFIAFLAGQFGAATWAFCGNSTGSIAPSFFPPIF